MVSPEVGLGHSVNVLADPGNGSEPGIWDSMQSLSSVLFLHFPPDTDFNGSVPQCLAPGLHGVNVTTSCQQVHPAQGDCNPPGQENGSIIIISHLLDALEQVFQVPSVLVSGLLGKSGIIPQQGVGGRGKVGEQEAPAGIVGNCIPCSSHSITTVGSVHPQEELLQHGSTHAPWVRLTMANGKSH